MSAFAELLVEARELGVERFEFSVVASSLTENGTTGLWFCMGRSRGGARLGQGRTGEEALRSLVDKVKVVAPTVEKLT